MNRLVVAILAVCAAAVNATAQDVWSYGPYIPGEKVSVLIPELVGYTAKGLPSGLKLNKTTGEISGSPKKPTGDDGVMVTFTKYCADTLESKFIVGPIPTITVTLEGDTEKCKVSGANKPYLVGKRVSLAAKGPKGTAFTGWFKDGEPWPNEEEYLNAKLKYVMTAESIDLVASFEKEEMSIDVSQLEDAWFTVGETVANGEVEILVETQSGLKSLTATRLPSGLSLKQNRSTGAWSIVGTPSKGGTYSVVLKAVSRSGAVEQVTVKVCVDEAFVDPYHGGVIAAKPVIYLYPEVETVCSVRLALNGRLSCTYPTYGSAGWQEFVASPDGTITFAGGRQYYCLYWEGSMNTTWDFSSGYCVKGSETAAFLADILLRMGLTFREANEFIIYWLPLMQDNPYNVIAFQGENYVQTAKLEIEPQPDSILRIFMTWHPSARPIELPAPTIMPFERKGFTVIEWGGSKVDAD